MNIRPATINDLSTLQSISRTTFSETFAHLNSEKNMRKYMENDLSMERLRKELMNLNSSFYLAQEKGETIGYLKLNDCGDQSDLNGMYSIEIERIYLLKSFHGQGVGKELLDHALSIARDKQKRLVWLGVWEKNHRAIAFYHKHGFVPYGTHIFRLGDEDQLDVLMRFSMT
jgi:ribosomal protein S18 acetylase RimI-like enzyme